MAAATLHVSRGGGARWECCRVQPTPRLPVPLARAPRCSMNKYASCSPECFVLALVYIDRLIQRNALLLTSLNVHR